MESSPILPMEFVESTSLHVTLVDPANFSGNLSNTILSSQDGESVSHSCTASQTLFPSATKKMQQSMSSDGGEGQPSSSTGNGNSSELSEIGASTETPQRPNPMSVVSCPSSPNYVTITAPQPDASTNGGNDLSYASLTLIKSSGSVEGGDDGVIRPGGGGSYVTYVDGSSEHPIFASTGNSTDDNVFPVYTVGESGQLYHPNVSGNGHGYYSNLPSAPVSYSGGQQVDGSDTSSGGAVSYMANQCTGPESHGGVVGQPATHATRVSPATVQWLLDNYEMSEGVSLPRSTLYYHYIKHTHENNLDPVNAASFGKLIRSVFLGLRTRRLGTRGNSKYHYYGIRVKPNSPLNALDEKTIEALMAAKGHGARFHHHLLRASSGVSNTSEGNGGLNGHGPTTRSQVNFTTNKRSRQPSSRSSDGSNMANGSAVGPESTSSCIERYLGDSSHVINTLPELDLSIHLPEGLVPQDLAVFHTLYRELCTQLLGDMMNFQFSEFQRRWRIFFRTEKCPANSVELQHYESVLPKYKLHAICGIPHVQDYVRRTDFQLYQNLSAILLPDVLRPIPSAMTQTIRNFAKVIETCMASALTGFPEEMIAVKLGVLNAFGTTLRRQTSLNHLAQAARAVLQNETQINQMLSDLNRVDFSNVEEQASWVCGCNSDLVPDLEADFKASLAQHQSLEEWASWLESVVDRVLKPHEATSRYSAVARYFLLKWSFYSSLVIRDLTLRSAASFGSFHLLRLLYDEYMFYLIENRVARAVNILPIAVIGKKLSNPLHTESNSTDDDSESFDTFSSHTTGDGVPSNSYANSENELQFNIHDQSNSPRSTSSTGNGSHLLYPLMNTRSISGNGSLPMTSDLGGILGHVNPTKLDTQSIVMDQHGSDTGIGKRDCRSKVKH